MTGAWPCIERFACAGSAGAANCGWTPRFSTASPVRCARDGRPFRSQAGCAAWNPATDPDAAWHETIYLALYALPHGELRRELLACLCQGRQNRRPRSRGSDRRTWAPDELRIAGRPEEIAERLIPDHWEGDLIKGAFNRSAVGTLVERSSPLVMLAQLDAPDAHSTQLGFERLFAQMPADLRRTMTYDRGSEMTCHQALTEDTGVKIYFADPHSPWQRGSDENANGLIRQYLPKGAHLSGYTQDDLDGIAARLNSRPRKVLDFRTPIEAWDEYLAAINANGSTVALQN